MKTVEIDNIKISKNQPLALIAGPCVIESEAIALETAERIRQITHKLEMPYIFKSSYLKVNHSSAKSYQGLRILEKVKTQTGIPVLSNIWMNCEENWKVMLSKI